MHTPSRDTMSHSASKEISHHLKNSEVNYHAHMSPSLVPRLSQIDWVHILRHSVNNCLLICSIWQWWQLNQWNLEIKPVSWYMITL